MLLDNKASEAPRSRFVLISKGIMLAGTLLRSISDPGNNAEYLETRLESSRIFPGQLYSLNKFMLVSFSLIGICFAEACSFAKWSTKAGMSCFRLESVAISRGITFKR